MPVLRRAPIALALIVSGAVAACGSPPKPAAPTTPPPAPIATAPKETPPDISPVPEPPGLVVVGRVSKPEALVAAAGSWTKLPLPAGPELLRSITEESVADVVDLSQPIDFALTVGLSPRHGVDALMAIAVAVKSYDQAKVKLGAAHRLVPGDNGQLRISGLSLGKSKTPRRYSKDPSQGAREDEDDDDDTNESCVLAPAAQGGRIICGEKGALEALAPYMSRTMPREKWTSDVHLELRPEPIRMPLQELRSSVSGAARSLIGGSPAMHELVESAVGEGVDIVTDAQKLSFDAKVDDSGVVATTRFEFQSARSVFACAVTTNRGDSPPAAFWHLPAETDTAFFGRGSDPKLFDHPRELLSNVLIEAADATAMPEADRKALKDLVADRMLSLFMSGTGIYAKGFDAAAVEKAVYSLKGVKDDRAAREEGRAALLTQIVGWHLYQVNEPVAKVGPMLKDWSALWNRPSFASWVKSKSSSTKPLPRMRIAPANVGGVTLPKDTVHLEITIPRSDLEVAGPSSQNKRGIPTTKKIPLKPFVVHVLAVPDGGATWLGIGLDAKLVAQRAAASLASAPDTNTLGKAAGTEALREGRINGGGFMTLRGFMVFTAMDTYDDHTPFSLLGTLPHKGLSPLVITGRAEAPSGTAKAGASVGSVRVTRAFIEDVVRLALASH